MSDISIVRQFCTSMIGSDNTDPWPSSCFD